MLAMAGATAARLDHANSFTTNQPNHAVTGHRKSHGGSRVHLSPTFRFPLRNFPNSPRVKKLVTHLSKVYATGSIAKLRPIQLVDDELPVRFHRYARQP